MFEPGEEEFNPGVLQDDGDGYLLEFDESEDAGAGGGKGGDAGVGAGAGAEGEGAAAGDGSGAAGGGDSPSQFVPLDKFNELNTQLAELRGRLAAKEESRPAAPQVEPGPSANQQAEFQAALKKRVKDISAKLYDPDTAEAAVEEMLSLGMQLGGAQMERVIAQRVGATNAAATDLIVENFLSKKEKKDEFYDEVEPLFEAELGKYDRAALAGRSRQDLVAAFEYIYKGLRADVLQKRFDDARARAKAKQQQIAPKLGGGKGADATIANRVSPSKNPKSADRMRQFILDAGFKEDQIDDILATSFNGGSEEGF